MTIRSVCAAVCAVLIALLCALPVASQEIPPEAGPATAAGPEDPFGRGVPRSAMQGYLIASREGDHERAAAFLDLRRLPRAARERGGPGLARDLKVVLDRQLWVDLEALSDQAEGRLDDGLPSSRELVGRVETPTGPVEILLQRVPREEDGVLVWKISAATVARVPALYAEFGYGPLGEFLPPVLFEIRLLEIELWQWMGLLALAPVAWLVAWLLTSALMRAARSLVSRTRSTLDDRLLAALVGPARLVLLVALFAVASRSLALSVPVQRALVGLEKAGAIVAFTWFLFRMADLAAELMTTRLIQGGRVPATQFVPMGRTSLKVLLVLLAILATLDSFGFDITPLLAGLGLSGLAVALAAQKSLENLIGGLTLHADQPVRVGDFCRFGDKVGTIEEVGMRSTRVRTLDRTLVTVPNGEFATMQLENFAKRDRILLKTMVGLRYETTPEQLRYALAELRSMLLAHSKVTADPARVRFVGFGAYSLDLEIFAYVGTSDWNEFLHIREDIYLRIMDIVERAGSGFAFPSQTMYLGSDDGVDAERGRAAEAQVEAWRREGRLPFPDFGTEDRTKMMNTLGYPPEGSAVAAES